MFDISTRRLAYHLQGRMGSGARTGSANVGVRYEEIQTKSSSSDAFVNTSRVLTPLAHVVWRLRRTATRPGAPEPHAKLPRPRT